MRGLTHVEPIKQQRIRPAVNTWSSGAITRRQNVHYILRRYHRHQWQDLPADKGIVSAITGGNKTSTSASSREHRMGAHRLVEQDFASAPLA